MNFFRQFFGIFRVSLSGAAQRTGAVLTIIIGVACAVGVLVSMLAMGIGMQRQAMENVRADRVNLSSTGARCWTSNIDYTVSKASVRTPASFHRRNRQ